jgi:hypothetical protein
MAAASLAGMVALYFFGLIGQRWLVHDDPTEPPSKADEITPATARTRMATRAAHGLAPETVRSKAIDRNIAAAWPKPQAERCIAAARRPIARIAMSKNRCRQLTFYDNRISVLREAPQTKCE